MRSGGKKASKVLAQQRTIFWRSVYKYLYGCVKNPKKKKRKGSGEE